MFELIKVILEILSKALRPSEIARLVKEKKLRSLGTDLFHVYLNLNEILICGEEIVNSISKGNDSYALTAGNWIRLNLFTQSINLARFRRAVQLLSKELQLIDANAHRWLRWLIEGKICAVKTLLGILGNGEIPLLGPTEKEITDISIEFNTLSLEEMREEIRIMTKARQLSDQLDDASVSTTISWDESVFKSVRTYLQERDPRKQLEYIREVAEQLKGSLEKYFSISDIILEVGDKRFDEDFL
jgi:hypothetical protein